jgi:hypothetical protein
MGLAAEPSSLPLAIRGYDPVAYFTQGRPMRGQPDFEHAWDGYRYHFVTAENRDLFKADPVRYAPQFEGLCAIALVDGYKDVADPENWLISDNKLYLFGGQRGPGRFGADAPGNAIRANETWLKLQK